ncbi:hypothetical protein GCM10010531_22670 [Blastococcus jejuensis]|uniref:FMN-binding domain-containing protein n=1 Tax=Blastococcus jejuensis TaxID=351224 RepID=A0ABP6P8I9_9ACTN
MRRIILWFMGTVSAVVFLFGYSTSTAGPGVVGGQTAVFSSGTSTTGGAASGGTDPNAGSTVTGTVAQTRWGPVQVELTVSGGAITQVSVLQYPDSNGHDRQINSYALPILVRETMDAQGANIDMVSGATVTSRGYLESLQSALDQAGL